MKTLNKIITIVALAIVAFSCGNKNTNKYVVSGTIEGVKDGTEIYLYNYERIHSRSAQPFDTAVITNGTYTFTDTINKPMMAYVTTGLRNGGLEFILEPGKIQINIADNKVSGTKFNDRLTQYFDACGVTEYQKESEEITRIYCSIEDVKVKDSLEKRFQVIHENYIKNANAAADKLFSENKDNILGKYAVLELMEAEPTVEQLLVCRDTEGSIVKDYKKLNTEIERMQSAEATSEGKPYVDFDCIDFNTHEMGKLSDVIGGKLALVDFWASWCSPCREEIKENLIRIHETYSAKGLVVVGVDVWDKMDEHAKMVEQLGIKYPQVIDTTRHATKTYGIRGIPEIMLVGPDGTILNRNIRGEEIEMAVRKALGE